MKILDPHLQDGVHEWRDGKRFVKEGVKLYLEGTETIVGRGVPRAFPARSVPIIGCLRIVTLDTYVRSFSHFTGCTLGEAIKCDVQSGAISRHWKYEGHALRLPAHTQTWSFLISAAMYLAHGTGTRKSGRKSKVLCMVMS